MAIITAMEELREDLDLSEDDIENIEANIADISDEIVVANEQIDNQMNSLRIAVEAYDDFSNKRISFDQMRYSVFAAESALNGGIGDNSLVFANEAVLLDRMTSAISNLMAAIKVSLSKVMDYFQYAFSWFSVQRGKINSLKSQLSQSSGDRAEISIGVNKYMRYGENQSVVRNMNEYNSAYREMCSIMAPFNSAIAELAEDDLFSSMKLVKEGLLGDPEKWFKDRFYSIEGHLQKAISGVSGHVSKRDRKYTEYQSPVLLGLSAVVVRMPEKSQYRSGEYEDMYGVHRYFYAYVDRKVKVKFSTILDGSIDLEVRKGDLIKNLDESLKLVEGALKLASMAARWSNVGSAYDGSAWIMSKRKQEEGFNSDFFETMMFYRRICAMIYDSVSSAYNFSMGNIKQMNRIADKVVAKL